MTKTKIKKINSFLQKKKIKYTFSYGYYFIACCEIGDSYYIPEENKPRKMIINDSELKTFIEENSEYIKIVFCEDCCACGGW